jgi:hypothetical protein
MENPTQPELQEKKKISGVRIIMFVLIVIIIIGQIRITKMIMDKEEAITSEPLTYAAKAYGIDGCTCYLSESKSIFFNQTASITQITKSGGKVYSNVDISKLNITFES